MSQEMRKKIEIIKNKMRTLGLALKSKKTLESMKHSIFTASIAASGLAVSEPIGIQSDTTHNFTDSSKLIEQKKSEIKASGVYKKIEINFAECTPHHLGWVFEAGMKPGIVDHSNKYIGLFQMDLGTTVGNFLKDYKNKYPKLSELGKTKAMRTLRNGEFQKEWAKSDSEEFRKDMSDFMDNKVYAPIFEELKNIDGLDLDRRGPAVQGMIMSAANQYGKNSVIDMVSLAYREAKDNSNGKDINGAELITNFYQLRAKRSPSLKRRLFGTDKNPGEMQMALDYQKYHVDMAQINLIAEHDQKSIFVAPLEAWNKPQKLPAESVDVKISIDEKILFAADNTKIVKKSKKLVKNADLIKLAKIRSRA